MLIDFTVFFGWVDVQARVSVCEWVSVCLLYPSIFIFSSSFCFLWFLVVFLSEMRMIYFVVLFVFVAVCFFLLYALIFYVYCRVLPDVLSLMFFYVPPLGYSEIKTTWLVNENENTKDAPYVRHKLKAFVTICKAQTESIRRLVWTWDIYVHQCRLIYICPLDSLIVVMLTYVYTHAATEM